MQKEATNADYPDSGYKVPSATKNGVNFCTDVYSEQSDKHFQGIEVLRYKLKPIFTIQSGVNIASLRVSKNTSKDVSITVELTGRDPLDARNKSKDIRKAIRSELSKSGVPVFDDNLDEVGIQSDGSVSYVSPLSFVVRCTEDKPSAAEVFLELAKKGFIHPELALGALSRFPKEFSELETFVKNPLSQLELYSIDPQQLVQSAIEAKSAGIDPIKALELAKTKLAERGR